MNLKEIFDRTIPLDESVRDGINLILTEGKTPKKGLNIFYKLDLELVKPKKEEPEEPQQPQTPVEPVQEVPQEEPLQQQNTPPVATPVATPEVPQETQQPEQSNPPDTSLALASTVTEDTIINDKKRIIRKSERKIQLGENEVNEIQSVDDILAVLSKSKESGVKIFDDFTNEVLTLCLNQNANELKNKVDKSSKIYFELYYGREKKDSIGLRISKRTNSDLTTYSILLDDEIVTTKFNIEKINKKIIEYRNYTVK